jgi:hypothetical protein
MARRFTWPRLLGRLATSVMRRSTRSRTASPAASRAVSLVAPVRNAAALRSVSSRWAVRAAGSASSAERNSTVSRRSRCTAPSNALPGLATSLSRVCADSRLSAGPAVSDVTKIHWASSVRTGTATNAMIFERIDQLRVLIRLRPRGQQDQGTQDHR